MKTITYPQNVTYYIVWNDDKTIANYGEITFEETMSSGLNNLYQTEIKEEFTAKLLNDFNINYID